MKHIIILGDGMADRPIARIGGKTPSNMHDLNISTASHASDAPDAC